MRASNIIYLIIPTLIILGSCTSCQKDPLDSEKGNTYTVEGTFYAEDGVTPIPNYPLQLVANKGSNIGGGSDYDFFGGTTDSTGYFKISYEGSDSYQSLDLGQPSSKTPVRGPFLTGIPANMNIERDICVVPKSLMLVKLNINRPITSKDSIMVSNIDARAINDSLYKYDQVNAAGYIYIQLIRNLKITLG